MPFSNSIIAQYKDTTPASTLRRTMPILAGIGLLGTLVFGYPAFAATATTTFNVTATVQATCQISATALGFGTYTGAQIDATSTITTTCTNTTPYNVGLNAGTTPAATVTTRKMIGTGGANLSYELFSETTRVTNWGNTVSTDTVSGIGNGSAQAHTVFGRLPAAQLVAPGAYTDTITATITY